MPYTLRYEERIEHLELQLDTEKHKSTRVGLLRLFSIIVASVGLYLYLQSDNTVALLLLLLGVSFFIFLIRYHRKVKNNIRFLQELIAINREEIEALHGHWSSFQNGEKYTNTEHPYTHDLDIFGEFSIFQYLNRTGTAIGQSRLAHCFIQQNSANILSNQEAIKELSSKLEWRQELTAKGRLVKDKEDSIQRLHHWAITPSFFSSRPVYRWLAYLLPAAFIGFVVAYVLTDQSLYLKIINSLFIGNLILFGLLVKPLKKEYEQLSDSSAELMVYAHLLEHVQHEKFRSDKLNQLHATLSSSSQRASEALKTLSTILFRLETMNYGIPALLANGFFLYTIHAIYSLNTWKKQYGTSVSAWLHCLAEIDALNSLANFSFNHPHYCFPSLIEQKGLDAIEMGHPLIEEHKRVYNSISFSEHPFVILTGSNMSGKSTFLRTLGLNLILAKMGAPVCCKEFNFYPFDIFLSMRINDSLQNNESFFYAELKRIKQMMGTLQAPLPVFIMLDEILRGTNSNDKYKGTIGLIERLIEDNATGIIATHDLMVTKLQEKYPAYISNQCFEVEIENNDLHFDYKLKKGVCEKMSASFLMQKMDIIHSA